MSIDVVNDLSPRVQYIATAAQVAFDYPFPIFEDADLVVEVDGVELDLGTDYSVTGEGDDAGGTVTLVAPSTAGDIVTIYRELQVERLTDIPQNGPLASAAINDEFDRITLVLQELKAGLERALRLPLSSGAEASDMLLSPIDNWKSKYIYIGATGVPEPATQLTAGTTLSRSTIGDYFQPITTAETAAGLVLADLTTFWPVGHVRRYGALGDGTTDDFAAIQRAVDVRFEEGGGQVVFDVGEFRHTQVINKKAHVDIYGQGYGSVLKSDDCNGIEFSHVQGYGNDTIANIYLFGVNGTTRTAIKHVGTNDQADEMYGLTLDSVLVTDYNVGISLQTVRNFTINNVWVQDVHKGLNLLGKNLFGVVRDSKFTYGAGNGTGDVIGCEMDYHNYTTSGGNVAPEGVHISDSQFFGFDTCIKLDAANYVTLDGVDVSGRVYGITFTTVQNGLSITDSYIEMSGANALVGIYGTGLASVIEGQINIQNTDFVGGAAMVGCTGLQINGPANQNQNHVNVVGCYFIGFQGYDILYNNPGRSNIIRNRCRSSGVTESIKIGTRVSGFIIATQNECLGGIEAEAADCLAGHVRIFDNTDDNGNTKHTEAIGWYEEGTWTPADGSGAALSFTGVNATYTKIGQTVLARAQLTYPVTASGSTNGLSGLPFALPASGEAKRQGVVSYSDLGTGVYVRPALGASTFLFRKLDGTAYTNAELSGKTFTFELRYTVS